MNTSDRAWSPTHQDWLRQEELRLLAFPGSVVGADGGAVLLDARGGAASGSAPTFVTARMAHVHAIAALRGHPGAREIATALLHRLGELGDESWPDLATEPQRARSLYTLDFVLLAAAGGVAIGAPAARSLLDRALARLDVAFWDARAGLGADRVDAAGEWGAYRGINGNMHLVEALFAVDAAIEAPELRARAVDISRFVIEEAAQRDQRILEHYDADWGPEPDHSRDRPDHPFVPYGSTVGHGFEWARLIAQADGLPRTEGFLSAASALFTRAASDGWARDGRDGFLYTVDWNGEPVSRRRLHWVAAEAIAAASVLGRSAERSGDAIEWYERVLGHVRTDFVDSEHGSWIHELDVEPDGKPDLYHAMTAVLTPQLPVATSLIAAVRSS